MVAARRQYINDRRVAEKYIVHMRAHMHNNILFRHSPAITTHTDILQRPSQYTFSYKRSALSAHAKYVKCIRQLFTKNELYDEQMLKDKKNGEYK